MSDQLQLAQQLNSTLQQAMSSMTEIESRITTQISIINNLSQHLETNASAFERFDTNISSFTSHINNTIEKIKKSFNLEELTNLYEDLENHVENTNKNVGKLNDTISEVRDNIEKQTGTAHEAADVASQSIKKSQNARLSVKSFTREALKNVEQAKNSLDNITVSFKETNNAINKTVDNIKSYFKALATGVFKSFKTVIGAIGKTFKTILTLPAQIAKGAVQFGNALRKDLVEEIGNAIQETKEFFDLNSNIGKGIQRLGRIGTGMLGTFQVAGSRMVKLFGFGTAGIVNTIKEFKDVLTAIGPFAEMFGATIANSKEQIEFFASMKRAYGLANEDYAYYALDASSKLQDLNSRIFQMGQTVFAVADEYGLDRKRLSLNFQKIRKDIINFDHLTDEELSHTTAKITQMKVKIEDVAAIFNKFSTFEDAAKSVALLSQTFGMNLDAMQLIRAEKPEEIFETFRNSMMETGRSFETLNRFEKQLLANQTGMSADTLKSVMNFRDAGLTYEQAIERANNSRPEKKQLKALKELRSAIKEIQKVMEFQSPFDAFFKGLKANALATGEFSSTLMKLSQGYEGIYNYAAGLDENTFFGILKPIKMIVDILTKLVTSKGFKKSLVNAVETFGKLISGSLGIGKGVSETYNIVSSIQKLKINKGSTLNASLSSILKSFKQKDLQKLGITNDYIQKISKKSVQDQLNLILIKMRKNVINDPKLQEAHDKFIKKFQVQYTKIDKDYQAKYSLVDDIKDGLKATSQSMIDVAGEYIGLTGVVAGSLLQGAAIVLTAGLELLSESLKPAADTLSNANNKNPSKTALEKIFGWDAGETTRMLTGLTSAFAGLFTTGNNTSIIFSLVNVFASVIGNALLMLGSVIKGILWDSWNLFSDDPTEVLEDARNNARSSSIGVSSSFNNLKFDTKTHDELLKVLKSIDNNHKKQTAKSIMLGNNKKYSGEYHPNEITTAKNALQKANIKEKDQLLLQADLAAQSEKIHAELSTLSRGQDQTAKNIKKKSYELGVLGTYLKALIHAIENNNKMKDPRPGYSGAEFTMTNEELLSELFLVHEEMKNIEEKVKQPKTVKDSRSKIVPGRSNNFVQPLNSASDINASGQVGFTNAMYAKFEKIESDSEVTLDLSSYSNQTKKFVASNNIDQLAQSAASLTQSVERLDKSIENSANRDNLVNVALGNDIIKEIFQVGAGLGCVDILSDPRYCQGRTSLSSIATNHSALQTGRTGRGYTTSYQVEHNK